MWNSFDAGRHEHVADSGSLKPHKEDYGGLVDPQRHYANETVTDENTGGNTSTSTSSTSTWMGVVSRPPLSADQPPSHAITDHGEPRSRTLPPLLLASTRGAESENKPQASTVVSTATAAAVSTDMVAAPVKVKKKRIRIKTERRREQCRLNQARYRNKQRSFAVDLEQTVEQLQQQVLQLEAQRRSLYFSVNTRDSATRAVVEYFRYFGGGLTVYEPRPGSSRPALEKQIVFVTSVFHHNTRVGDDYGSEFFLEQWRRFSTFYGGLRILPQRYTPQSKPEIATVVEADVILQVTITETTIRQLYPHLLHWRYNGIKWKLLGRRINFSSVLGFDFDEDGKVTCVEWTIDFIEAFRQFLTIDETAIVLQQAQVVRDAYLLESGEREVAIVDSEDVNRHSSHVVLQSSALNQGLDEGFLIHDGKGDDFVMV